MCFFANPLKSVQYTDNINRVFYFSGCPYDHCCGIGISGVLDTFLHRHICQPSARKQFSQTGQLHLYNACHTLDRIFKHVHQSVHLQLYVREVPQKLYEYYHCIVLLLLFQTFHPNVRVIQITSRFSDGLRWPDVTWRSTQLQ